MKLKKIIFIITIIAGILTFCFFNKVKLTCEKNYKYSTNSIINQLDFKLSSCEYRIYIKHKNKEKFLDENKSHKFFKDYTINNEILINVNTDRIEEEIYVFKIINLNNDLISDFEIYTDGIIKINGIYKQINETNKIFTYLKNIKF